MKLRTRQKGKKDQALDFFASVVKSLADSHVAERAGKGAKKGAKNVGKGVKKVSVLRWAAKSKPAKVVGGAAVVGGAGALIAKKLKGSDPDPIYTAPAPTEPKAVAPTPEVEAVAADAAQAAAADAPLAPAEPLASPEATVGAETGVVADPEIAEPDISASAPAPADVGAPEPPGEGAEEPVREDDQPAPSTETWST
ncbi:MAG TPA: hypothetical protein VF526_05905 [Solirubrobacteraceae bacterium]|jgi:hypothetical protein